MRSRLLPLAVLCLATVVRAADAPVPRWEQMDYGPFLMSSVTLPWSRSGEDPADITLKGLTVRLAPDATATFDTGLLRWSAAWTGDWLKLMGTPFDGTHRPPERSRPAVAGTVFLATSALPGWAKDGDWRDPRSEPYLPLPRDWGRFLGHHVAGNRVSVDYAVSGTAVSEAPWIARTHAIVALGRALRVGPHRRPLRLLAVETMLPLRNRHAFDGSQPTHGQDASQFGDQCVVAPGLPAGSRWHVEQGTRLVLELPASSTNVGFPLVVGRGLVSDFRAALPALLADVPDPDAIARGGPSGHPQTLVTRGKQGDSGAAYAVDTITAPDDNPWHSWLRFGGFDFFPDGNRAALATWNGDVWIVSGLDGSLERLEWRRFATGLFQPLGLRIVGGLVHVLGRDQITRLRDVNGDGEADAYECFNNEVGITPNFHEFALDLHTDPAGNFYFNKGAPLLGTEYWDPICAHNGCVIKVSADGSRLERFATGLRAPNGLGVGPRGEVTCSDNEGIWTPVCRLNWVRPGGFYGAVGMDHGALDLPARRLAGWEESDFAPRYPDPRYDPPLCWLPFAIDNSSGSQVWAPAGFGPLSGELIHLSYGKCRAFHVLREEVRGVMQGGVAPLPWTFDSSAMRGRPHPKDGSLYVCGLKGWQTTAARDGAFHRVRFTGKPFPRLVGVHVRRDGYALDFNEAVDPAAARDPQNWNLQQWNYRWSRRYGSDLYSVADPGRVTGKKGSLKGDPIDVKSVEMRDGGKRVVLSTGATRPVMQWMLKAALRTAGGAEMPVEYYGTVNAVP
ncbi:MAG: hypothetical protein DVB31_04850 [Verrucomicrobia bacterium]|nr:MAG: hypothetical protein DVB31_04850 [Verrucomicrobiota bacterium]